MDNKDYYKILNVKEDATHDEIKKSYRSLSKKYHPDKNPNNKEAEEKFKELSIAYSIIGDESKRKEYDYVQSHQSYADEFNNVYGEYIRKQTMRGFDIAVQLDITFKDAFEGTEKTITGIHDDKIKINIKPGARTGLKFRLKGKGEISRFSHPDAEPGDLIIIINVINDTDFIIKGFDLYKHIDIPIYDSLLGCNYELELYDKKIKINIPPQVKDKHTLRIPNQGFPIYGTSNRGNFYIIINIDMHNFDKKEKDALKELQKYFNKKNKNGKSS